ncbi:histidine triad (HIT) family protein [Friedmanniella endophytica]|uniref:Histidine triad (HIT) family protein n=1 Tax=Microlunatus kandeliicorticis TaxID=1759536 RepID=A0A7W3P6R9_9ACTN|nr:HIT domain-containing protein [Microlunatus kandeliicorticis]MBA8795237.1 histidine triad (HIT) family protein [Microlunatus kandeliicorticis]
MPQDQTDCIFCRIVAGELPSRQVHADEHAVAFLDLAPFHRGHTLVVPRRHVADLRAGGLPEIAPAVEHVARLLTERLGAEGLNAFSSAGAVAGQEVFHLHVHLVPRYADSPGLRGLFSGKHGADAAELDAVHAQLTGQGAA